MRQTALQGKICAHGVPLRSHLRCRLCTRLLGCAGEAQPGRDGLCAQCEQEQAQKTRLFLKPAEVARMLGLSTQTIRKLLRGGELKGTLVGRTKSPNGRRYLVSRAALSKYLDEQPPR